MFLCIFTQRRSVAKDVSCFQRDLFACVWLCGFVCLWSVCQHDNFQTSKHRMMKLGSRCIVQKFWRSSNLGVIALCNFVLMAIISSLNSQKCLYALFGHFEIFTYLER